VAFDTLSSTLVPGDTNGVRDVFLRDRANATTELVSIGFAGAQADSASYAASISPNGRFVAFHSDASNLIAADTNFNPDVFVRDRVRGTTERVSVDSAGAQSDSYTQRASFSTDARYVAFDGIASNLVAGDTNWVADVFVRDRGVQVPASYCTAGTSSHGCAATLSATAEPSVSLASACIVSVAGIEGQRSCTLFYGIDNTGFAPGPWAQGSASSLCAKKPLQRTPAQSSGGTINACDGAFALDWSAYQTAHPLVLGNPWSVGAKVFVQAWFRDPTAAKSSNLGNALEMTYVP
jgi:hypothetical protein